MTIKINITFVYNEILATIGLPPCRTLSAPQQKSQTPAGAPSSSLPPHWYQADHSVSQLNDTFINSWTNANVKSNHNLISYKDMNTVNTLNT